MWRDVQALHIFIPPARLNILGENWGNEIIGQVIKPIVEGYSFRWFWITRYLQPVAHAIPPDFVFHSSQMPDVPLNAFILLRLSTEDKLAKQRALELAREGGYFVVGWEEYDVVADLGKDRFIHSDATEAERVERAHQIAMFMSWTATLLVGALQQDSGRWVLESNSDLAQNPNGSFFQSVHHLFCNATEVPLAVKVSSPFQEEWVRVRF